MRLTGSWGRKNLIVHNGKSGGERGGKMEDVIEIARSYKNGLQSLKSDYIPTPWQGDGAYGLMMLGAPVVDHITVLLLLPRRRQARDRHFFLAYVNDMSPKDFCSGETEIIRLIKPHSITRTLRFTLVTTYNSSPLSSFRSPA
jgi:hypothetical protein